MATDRDSVSWRQYLGRKFLLTFGSLGGTFYLALQDKLTTEWGLALGVILAFYNGANVAQKYVDMQKSNAEIKRLERDPYDYSDYSPYEGRRY